MPYTTNKGFSVPATGSLSGTWGSDGSTPTAGTSNAINQGVTQLLDQALAGVTPLSLSSSNVTLTQLQCQNGMLRMSGALANDVTLSPDSGVLMVGFYCWENLTTVSHLVTLSNGGGSVVLPQARRGVLWIDGSNGPRIISIVGSSTADPVPAGSVVPFYNNAVPAGYTVVSLNDYALKIVSSSGGVTSGSVAYSTLFGRTATDGYALLVPDIPSHTHFLANVDGSSSGGQDGLSVSNQMIQQWTPGSSNNYILKGSATAATIGLTGATGGGGSHAHAIDMRVNTVALVLGTRN